MAARSFSDGCQDPDTVLSKHPTDFTLYFIGCFDDSSGAFEPEQPIEFVAKGDKF